MSKVNAEITDKVIDLDKKKSKLESKLKSGKVDADKSAKISKKISKLDSKRNKLLEESRNKDQKRKFYEQKIYRAKKKKSWFERFNYHRVTRVNIPARVIQHLIFIMGSIGLFIVNHSNNSMIGMVASSCFIVGNMYGIYLYLRKKPVKLESLGKN